MFDNRIIPAGRSATPDMEADKGAVARVRYSV